jgi:hypothetical protein
LKGGGGPGWHRAERRQAGVAGQRSETSRCGARGTSR